MFLPVALKESSLPPIHRSGSNVVFHSVVAVYPELSKRRTLELFILVLIAIRGLQKTITIYQIPVLRTLCGDKGSYYPQTPGLIKMAAELPGRPFATSRFTISVIVLLG